MSSPESTSTETQSKAVAIPATRQVPLPDYTAVAGRALWKLTVAVLLLGSIPAVYFGYQKWHAYRTEQYKTACKEARDGRQWKKLDVASKMWCEWDPDNDDARMFRAEAYLQDGQLKLAADTVGAVSDDYHSVMSALAFQGEILFGDLDLPYEAEKVWLRMQRLHETADLPRQRLIYFYSMSLQREKLIAQLRRGIELAAEPPESYTYLMLSGSLNFTDGIQVLERWRKNYPNDEQLEVAEAFYFAKNRTSGEGALFDRSDVVPGDLKPMLNCLEKYPKNLEVVAFHLDKRVFDGDVPGVAQLVANLPTEAENDSRIWRHRAWLLKVESKYEQALQAIDKSILLDRFDWRSKWEKAALLRILGRRDEAEAESKLANEGKALERKLLEQPNAQMLTWGLVEELRAYFQKIGDKMVLEGIERRMPTELLQDTANPME